MPQGFKTCECGVHTHNKSKAIVDGKCPACGKVYPIVDKTKAKREPRQEEIDRTTSGHGWVHCTSCQKYTAGPRSLNCVHCNEPFKKVVEQSEPIEVEDSEAIETEVEYHTVSVYPTDYEYPENLKYRGVTAATGECPYRLRSNDEGKLPAESAIRAWAFKVRQEMMKRDNIYLRNEALLRWAINEVNADLRFGRQSEEMKYLKDVINTVPDIQLKKVAV